MDKTLPLPEDRRIYFNKQVNQDSIGDLSSKIIDINAKDNDNERIYGFHSQKYTRPPIKIYIDSYGGSVYQCLGLLSIMDNSTTPIHTIITGCAMSCGFMIAISGHERFAHKHSTLMYHQVSSGMWGKVQDMEQDIEETKRLQSIIEDITVKKTKIKPAALAENYKMKKDWFMPADEALKNGCIDKIL